jgi:hypothetical protein
VVGQGGGGNGRGWVGWVARLSLFSIPFRAARFLTWPPCATASFDLSGIVSSPSCERIA